MMATDPIGLYVHVPFCVRKCNYCDFASDAASVDVYEVYCDRLTAEIESYCKAERIKLDTVFFGGGTPSLLPHELFEKIVLAIRKSFDLSPLCEFSIEANPGTLTEEKLRVYKRLGVNRISIGLQSIHENEMKILGRIHNYDDFREAFDLARRVGFDNINVDIMYGIPAQTEDSFEKTLTALTSLMPEHISCYGLMIEKGTPFYKIADELQLPSEDEEADMYYKAASVLAAAGYRHYEISNYSKPSFECRHNLKYWRDEEYIGVGLAAHSYFGGERYSNPSDMKTYLGMSFSERSMTADLPSPDAFELAMLRFRLSEGLSLKEYESRFSTDFRKGREAFIEKLISEGYMLLENGHLKLTERGFYVSNYILSELL